MTAVAGGASAPAAMAADDCPNAAVRAQQFRGAELPNCLAYERVTPNDKNGSNVLPDSVMTEDGSTISVWASVHLFDTDASGHQNVGIAMRQEDGWKIRFQTNTPLWGVQRNSDTFDGANSMGQSTDLQKYLFQTAHPVDPDDHANNYYGGVLWTRDLYVSKQDGSMTWVTRPAGALPAPGTTVLGDVEPAGSQHSDDLSEVWYATNRVMNPAVDSTVRLHIWHWKEADGSQEPLDILPDGSLSTATTQDGAQFFNEGTAAFVGGTAGSPRQLYLRRGIGTASPSTVLVSSGPAGPCGQNVSYAGITRDMRYVAFYCGTELIPGTAIVGGQYWIKDLQTGALVYGQPLSNFGPSARPGGDSVVYHDRWRLRAATSSERNGSTQNQLALVDQQTNAVTCVSCPADGSTPSGAAEMEAGMSLGASGGRGRTRDNWVTPDGEVVFTTASNLVPGDTNGQNDVYMWKDGKHHLLTGGVSPVRSELGGVSKDGSTISIATATSMVPSDRDGGEPDIYVLRKNGGFLHAADTTECTTDCQGPGAAPAAPVAPLSVHFPATGDQADEDVDPIGVSGSRSVRGTSLKIKVRTPGGGRVTVSGSGLRKASRTAKSATSASVTVRLSARSKRLLRKRSSVKVRATVRFVPTEGAPQSKRVNLTFRKAKKKTSKKQGASRGVATASNGKAAR